MVELSNDLESSKENELHPVVFNVGTEEFGVEITSVQEIIRMTNITRVPQAPGYVMGIINLRGHIIVVISLSEIMGIETREHNEDTRIIVADIGSNVLGFVVDSVSEVIRLPEKNIEPTPQIIANKIGAEYVNGIGKMDNRLLILLNLKNVLGADELKAVSNIPVEDVMAESVSGVDEESLEGEDHREIDDEKNEQAETITEDIEEQKKQDDVSLTESSGEDVKNSSPVDSTPVKTGSSSKSSRKTVKKSSSSTPGKSRSSSAKSGGKAVKKSSSSTPGKSRSSSAKSGGKAIKKSSSSVHAKNKSSSKRSPDPLPEKSSSGKKIPGI